MKKLLLFVLCTLLLLSFVPSVFAEKTSVDLTQNDITLDGSWEFGDDDIFMQSYGEGWWYYDNDFSPYNSIKVTLRMYPTLDHEGVNLMMAFFIAENGNGYCFEYYPYKSMFDISYNDAAHLCESEQDFVLDDGNDYEITCLIQDDTAAIVFEGKVVCSTPLEECDKGQVFSQLKGWSWNCCPEITKYTLVNDTYNLSGEGEVVETTEVPETTAPETAVPETTIPETAVPETNAPETNAPEVTEEPKTDETEAPEKKSSGCGSTIVLAPVSALAILGVCIMKKKEN